MIGFGIVCLAVGIGVAGFFVGNGLHYFGDEIRRGLQELARVLELPPCDCDMGDEG